MRGLACGRVSLSKNLTMVTVELPNKGHVGYNINSAVLSFIERLPYSRKFSHGANFHGFHGWPHYHKIRTAKVLMLVRTPPLYGVPRWAHAKVKTMKVSSVASGGVSAKVSRYTVSSFRGSKCTITIGHVIFGTLNSVLCKEVYYTVSLFWRVHYWRFHCNIL